MTKEKRMLIIRTARRSNFHWQCQKEHDLERMLIEKFQLPCSLLDLDDASADILLGVIRTRKDWVTARVYQLDLPTAAQRRIVRDAVLEQNAATPRSQIVV